MHPPCKHFTQLRRWPAPRKTAEDMATGEAMRAMREQAARVGSLIEELVEDLRAARFKCRLLESRLGAGSTPEGYAE